MPSTFARRAPPTRVGAEALVSSCARRACPNRLAHHALSEETPMPVRKTFLVRNTVMTRRPWRPFRGHRPRVGSASETGAYAFSREQSVASASSLQRRSDQHVVLLVRIQRDGWLAECLQQC